MEQGGRKSRLVSSPGIRVNNRINNTRNRQIGKLILEDITMMDKLKEKLHTGQCSLVVLHDGNINTFEGRGVRRLYNLITEEPELFLDSKLADKAIGSTAAKMMVNGGVCEVYADVISEQALNTLKDAGIKVSYEKKVDHRTFLKIWEKMGEIGD